MTANERLALVRTKVERAKQHVSNLEEAIRTFLDSHPYSIGTKLDQNFPKGERYYIDSVREIPTSIALLAGDTLFNLRSALDHLAYQLADINGATDERVLKQTYFPIFDDALEYETKKGLKVRGLSESAKKAVDAVKPYKGGNDALWQLHRLNIIDKHRALLTAGMAIARHSLPLRFRGPTIQAIRAQRELPPEWEAAIAENPSLEELDMSIRPVHRKCPLKAGDELTLGWEPSFTFMDEKVDFTFDVAINEPQIIESEPLLPLLVGMADLVDDLISNFETLLA